MAAIPATVDIADTPAVDTTPVEVQRMGSIPVEVAPSIADTPAIDTPSANVSETIDTPVTPLERKGTAVIESPPEKVAAIPATVDIADTAPVDTTPSANVSETISAPIAAVEPQGTTVVESPPEAPPVKSATVSETVSTPNAAVERQGPAVVDRSAEKRVRMETEEHQSFKSHHSRMKKMLRHRFVWWLFRRLGMKE